MRKACVSNVLCFLLLLSLDSLAAAPSDAPSPELPAAGSGLEILQGDIRIQPADGGGYDLFIRGKPGVASVLLTESTKDPIMKADNFAYRAVDYNRVNGDEVRVLNGKALSSSINRYSLISSTPTSDEKLGSAFHILIPPVLVYGYPWSRSGTVAVGMGTYLNIRAFSKPYADYSGAFRDNPYRIGISYAPIKSQPVQEQPKGPAPENGSVSSKFGTILGDQGGGSLDLVICLDTTASMVPYFEDIKKGLGPMLRERTAGFGSYRIGVVLYKDYWPDEYITRKFPFTTDISKVEGIVRSATIYGGGDIPEALNEALYSAATEFDWSADRRQIIFLTDAAPHPIAKGKILFSDVIREAGERKIAIDSVIVPASIPPPNPPHLAFENERKQLAAIGSASGTPQRIIALTEGVDASARSKDIQEELFAPLSSDSRIAIMGARELLASDDESALKLASGSGANLLILYSTIGTPRATANPRPTGAMAQTVSRLLDVASGRELARDVTWRVGLSTGDEALFVNGLREK